MNRRKFLTWVGGLATSAPLAAQVASQDFTFDWLPDKTPVPLSRGPASGSALRIVSIQFHASADAFIEVSCVYQGHHQGFLCEGSFRCYATTPEGTIVSSLDWSPKWRRGYSLMRAFQDHEVWTLEEVENIPHLIEIITKFKVRSRLE